jgi:glutamate/tyrosine decarboxylase-like PLP-dependent enzyme
VRTKPLELDPETFRALGRRLVDRLATFLEELPSRPVHPGESAAALRARLGGGALPATGADPGAVLDEAADLLLDHSVLNGHPRFMGYITSTAAPIGALADVLAATVNPNCGSFGLSPMGTLIEEQSVRWIAELLRLPAGTGGILVSGGNMANLVAYWAARAAGAGRDVRVEGLSGDRPLLTAYCSTETHTWIQKAADLSGLGTGELRWIPVDGDGRMDVAALRTRISADRAAGHRPFMVVGTAGTVSTGAIDPLREIRDVCREERIWFHVDGAYGAPAVIVPGTPTDLEAMADADSVAIDPHKWLYAPLEVGCTLVRDPTHLHAAFGYTPAYYHFETDEPSPPPNYYELGPQNSRGLRALKVWMGLRQAGREGLAQSIADDMRLSRELFALAKDHPEIEAVTQGLSITTFRYVPQGADRLAEDQRALNALNERLLDRLQRSGRAYVSNALVNGRYVLRACIVNFRTDRPDLEALIEAVVDIGRELASTG